ncbi:MAG: serine/threonine-protein kinase, partial [Gemmatimonadaceae bacterium]
MAVVFLARDVKHDRQVAIKVMRPTSPGTRGKDRFQAEIRLIAGLRHQNIVPLYDSGETDGWIFFVMPFVDGETLRDRLQRETTLSEHETIRIARDVAAALDYAHQHGVVHRDIKPANILLDEAGHALVADFGIARGIHKADGARDDGMDMGPASSGFASGTPAYMSPEQVAGAHDLDGSSDVYSMGCLTYEMLVGIPPFTGIDARAVRAPHLLESPGPMRVTTRDLSVGVEQAILRSLAKAPSDRFRTAGDFVAALSAGAAQGTVSIDNDDQADREHERPLPLPIESTILVRHDRALRALGRAKRIVASGKGRQWVWRSGLLLAAAVAATLATTLTSAREALRLSPTPVDTLAVRRLLNRGIQGYYRGDSVGAVHLLQAAHDLDSTNAIVSWWLAMPRRGGKVWGDLMESARRHSATASVRERLTIELFWARSSNDPTEALLADSLRLLYPDDPRSYLELSSSRELRGDFLGMIPLLNRVIALDSSGFHAPPEDCHICRAYENLVWTYVALDSLGASERTVRAWLAQQTDNATPWFDLAWHLAHSGRSKEAYAAWNRVVSLGPPPDPTELRDAQLSLYLGDFPNADRVISSAVASRDQVRRTEGWWWRVVSLRMQGRLRDALAAADSFAATVRIDDVAEKSVPKAIVLLEMGRAREARELFASVSTVNPWSFPDLPASHARWRTWSLTHAATAAAAVGDSLSLKALADTVDQTGHISNMERDRRLHHYVRANVFRARGALTEAVEQYRLAIETPTRGYTRINLELAGVLMMLKHPEEAVTLLRAALHGVLDANNLYVTRTALHFELAKAFDAANAGDSAIAHYRDVESAWSRGDPQFRALADSSRRRIEQLSARDEPRRK